MQSEIELQLPKLSRIQSSQEAIQTKINVDVILKEFLCNVCIEQIDDCYITKCGHVFCKECIAESINRHHKCPFCNTELNQSDVFKNYHFNSLKKIIINEQQKETQNYLNNVFQQSDQFSDQKLQNIFRSYLSECALLYKKKFQQTEETFNHRRIDIKKNLLQNIMQYQYDIEKLKSFQIEFEQENFLLDEQNKQINNFYLESLQKTLKKIQIDPDIQEVRVSFEVPDKNIVIDTILLQPNTFIKELKQQIYQIFTKKNDKINQFDDEQVFIVSIPYAKINLYKNLFIQNKNLNYEAFKMLISQQNDKDLFINNFSNNDLLLTMNLMPGSLLMMFGVIKTQSDLPSECMTYKFKEETILDYYSCKTCNINWICEGCKHFCHKDHQTQKYLTGHTATWACCYCVSKGFCKALNKNSLKQ